MYPTKHYSQLFFRKPASTNTVWQKEQQIITFGRKNSETEKWPVKFEVP